MRSSTLRHRILTLLLSVCLCLGLLPASALAASTTEMKVALEVDYSASYEALDYLNEYRRQAGLKEVAMDAQLLDMAVRRAAECTINFYHTRPNGKGFDTARPSAYANKAMGENILRGTSSAKGATDGWYRSDGHRANMLDARFTAVGIACVRTLSGEYYWVQVFADVSATPESSPSSGQKSYYFNIDVADEYIDLRIASPSLRLNAGDERSFYVLNGTTPVVPAILNTGDPGVATLSLDGSLVRVSAVGSGTTDISMGFAGHVSYLTVTVSGGTASTPSPSPTVQPSPAPSTPSSGTLEHMTLSMSSDYLYIGESMEVTLVLTPADAAVGDLTWATDQPGVVSISPHGTSCTLTALSSGIAQLSVSTYSGGEQHTCLRDIIVPIGENSDPAPTVQPSPTPTPTPTPTPPAAGSAETEDLDLSATYLELMPGETLRLMAYVRPAAADQSVTWKSLDTSVATVDQNGRVTAVADGQTDIVVTTADGSESRRCQVSVTTPFTGKPILFTDVKEGDYCYDAVAWATAQNLVDLTSSTEVGAAKPCTRMELVRYLWKLMGSPLPEDLEGPYFTDLPGSYSSEKLRAIQWAVENGITTGTTDDTFSPNMTVTRAQAVTFLYRLAGSPSMSGSVSFADVPAGDWFASAAVWAVQEGLTNGTSANTFTPGRDCSRGEILTFLYRQFG